jgi:hypothetical protein
MRSYELAHAYHDQLLGFDDLDIMAAWKRPPQLYSGNNVGN